MFKMGMCGSKNDTTKSKTFELEVCAEHENGINCMALSEDGSVLASGSEDKTARLWSTKSEHCECIGILQGHEDYVNCILIEDNYVLTGSADKTVRKWDMSTCDCICIFRGHNSLINRIICTGDFVFSSSYDRTARCWDFDTGECIRVFSGHKRGVYPLIFIPGEDDYEFDDEEREENDEDCKDILISGSPDFTAKSWSFETGKCLKTFKGHTGAVTCMTTDPVGRTLFTGGTDNTIRSWDITKGEQLKLFAGHQGAIICITLVNKILYSGSSDHTARSWVPEFGDCTRIFKGHRHTVSCVRFHEGLLFTGCGDNLARVYDAKSGALKRSFKGHESAVNCLQISEGKLFTGSHDATLRVWDASGMRDDTAFGGKDDADKKEKEKENAPPVENHSNGQTKIMLDDDYDQNGHMNGNGVSNGLPIMDDDADDEQRKLEQQVIGAV
ncbi:unnamed protein product [Owenia fusiformis]|uniref:Uncharacterized protein n=1 Tax=Owenia fusiformis TaxID=6347 RepID=A0A8J1XSA1_OWEFU|nr:unnamed protein product [Owenia fusiformis]